MHEIRVIDPGHSYELPMQENKLQHQTLTFIKKVQQGGPRLETVQDGTTNEAVLNVLIDRLQSANAKLPSRETSMAITKIQEALMWLEQRTKDRTIRGVEGTQNK